MSQQNLVSMVITEDDEREVMQALDLIEARLKGLVSLEPHGRRFKRMGAKEEIRARGIIRALQQNPQIVPPHLDVAGAVADLDALERMVRIDDRTQRLAALIKDTRSALGIDIMAVAKLGYNMTKTFGGSLGLGELVKEFGARFTGPRKKAKAEGEPDSGA